MSTDRCVVNLYMQNTVETEKQNGFLRCPVDISYLINVLCLWAQDGAIVKRKSCEKGFSSFEIEIKISRNSYAIKMNLK